MKLSLAAVIVGTMIVSPLLGFGAAYAQSPPASTATPPASTAAPAATPSATDKKQVSKSCSDQANAKGLHGKARKDFRSACKKNGGSAPN